MLPGLDRPGERVYHVMNINYIIGLVGALAVFLFGCVTTLSLYPKVVFSVSFANLWNFFDAASILITIGCTLFIVMASFPGSMLKAMPKHFGIILKNKVFDPVQYIDQLVELAQIARKNGLLSLEEKANGQQDPFSSRPSCSSWTPTTRIRCGPFWKTTSSA